MFDRLPQRLITIERLTQDMWAVGFEPPIESGGMDVLRELASNIGNRILLVDSKRDEFPFCHVETLKPSSVRPMLIQAFDPFRRDLIEISGSEFQDYMRING